MMLALELQLKRQDLFLRHSVYYATAARNAHDQVILPTYSTCNVHELETCCNDAFRKTFPFNYRESVIRIRYLPL